MSLSNIRRSGELNIAMEISAMYEYEGLSSVSSLTSVDFGGGKVFSKDNKT